MKFLTNLAIGTFYFLIISCVTINPETFTIKHYPNRIEEESIEVGFTIYPEGQQRIFINYFGMMRTFEWMKVEQKDMFTEVTIPDHKPVDKDHPNNYVLIVKNEDFWRFNDFIDNYYATYEKENIRHISTKRSVEEANKIKQLKAEIKQHIAINEKLADLIASLAMYHVRDDVRRKTNYSDKTSEEIVNEGLTLLKQKLGEEKVIATYVDPGLIKQFTLIEIKDKLKNINIETYRITLSQLLTKSGQRRIK
jgi:hypothetical protein